MTYFAEAERAGPPAAVSEQVCAPVSAPVPAPIPVALSGPVPAPREVGGREGPDPTRFGDWELRGRCIDF